MFISEKKLVNQLLQFAAFLLLGIYTYVTYPTSSLQLKLAIASALLFAYGRLRKTAEALIVCVIAVIVYGGYIYYRAFWGASLISIGWNELVWLIALPTFTLLGAAFNRKSLGDSAELEAAFFGTQSVNLEHPSEICVVDENLGFATANTFLYKVEEKVLVTLRERSTFRIMLVQIEHFREFKLLFGNEHARSVLSTVAEWIAETESEARAQVGESVLACILPPGDSKSSASVQENIKHRFYDFLLTRPRREATVKLNLRFGFAECPGDGIEAKSLMEKARTELSWSGIENKG